MNNRVRLGRRKLMSNGKVLSGSRGKLQITGKVCHVRKKGGGQKGVTIHHISERKRK